MTNEIRCGAQRDPLPRDSIRLPHELGGFLRDHEIAGLFHSSDIGTLLVVKVPARELLTLGGPLPIQLVHELYAHPHSPVIRSLITFIDRPESPLSVETFTNIADPDQHAAFAALGEQEELPLLFYDETLRHRLSKRLRNTTAPEIPAIISAADHMLRQIPEDRRDFARAKVDVMEATSL